MQPIQKSRLPVDVSDNLLVGLTVAAVQIEKSTLHGFIFIDPLLKPVIGFPRLMIGAVYTVFGKSFHIFLAFLGGSSGDRGGRNSPLMYAKLSEIQV